ncbi:MFS transporter [Nonomuraea endophytica]|uniref:MFS transporter n=1 Tax=Nonomuraea endophytica TaxID=714136 RepID=UPI0037C63353
MTAQFPGADALGPWIVLAYNGLFAAALLLAGATADRSARTRFFALGNLVVATTGILSAFAPDLPSLVVLRVIAGVRAAMCAAGGSSMILAVYPPEERRRVYGYAGAVLGSSLALGPVVAQGLMAVGGWPLVFLAPAAVAGLAALSTVGLPALRGPETPATFDLAGAVLFGVTIAASVTSLGLGPGGPWWAPAGLVLIAAALGVALVRVERRAPDPAIPLDLLRIPAYRAYGVATGAFMGVTEGVPDGQALKYVPYQRGGAGAALFSTTRMSLETLTLAAATGVMAVLGPAVGMAVAGIVCLVAAVVVRRAVPARPDVLDPDTPDARRVLSTDL